MARKQRKKTAKKSLNQKLLRSVILVTLILLASLVAYYLFFLSHQENWTAAIVDQLSVQEELKNQTFIDNCNSTLTAAGYDVNYYPGDDVTVNFYRDLPSKGGKIIILRTHSAVRNNTNFVDLFTSEKFDDRKHLSYEDQISHAQFLVYPYTEYFAIGPTFVDRSMRGRFDSDCVIILMGCDGLKSTTMAEALVGKGAKVVIGWTGLIDLTDTDKVTLELLERLLSGSTIFGAVDWINKNFYQILEHLPRFGAKLAYYPETAEDYRLMTREIKFTSLILASVKTASLLLLLTTVPQNSYLENFYVRVKSLIAPQLQLLRFSAVGVSRKLWWRVLVL
ncbi:MAG: hypothetical protein ACLFU9_07650 [Candidatus Bathyarchaeia archaeon]